MATGVVPPSPDGQSRANYDIIAALDFGTTFSAYAFSIRSENEHGEAILNKKWGANVSSDSVKVPTCVLTSPDGQFHSFGYEALAKFNQLHPDLRKPDQYNLYRNFKMLLHENRALNRYTVVTSTSGTQRPAMDIFAMAIQYLKEHMFETIKGQYLNINEEKVLWVLSVPAIWSVQSKQFMREAAFKAGIMSDIISKNLVLSLEPEAAAMFCKTLQINLFSRGPDQLDNRTTDFQFKFKALTRFVVIDAGGGTIDITSHETTVTDQLREIYPPTGGPWGGTKVDENFEHLLKEILGEEFINEYKEKEPYQWFLIMTQFQKAKCDVTSDKSAVICIPITRSLDRYFSRSTGEDIEERIQSCKNLDVTYSNDMLVLSYEAVKNLFQPVVDLIVQHMKMILGDPRLKNLTYIILVGGFGQNIFLKQAILQNFRDTTKVLLPIDAQTAVIRGSVKFGQKPDEIQSRISRFTYGSDISVRFEKNVHDERKKIFITARGYLCKDVFEIFVHKDEEVNVGDVKSFISQPYEATSTAAYIRLFSTEKRSPKYVDGEGVQQIGQLFVELPDTTLGLEREIETRVSFGGTEIVVEMREITREGAEPERAAFDFLTQ